MKNIPRNRDRKKAMKMENTRPKTRRQLVEKDKIIYIYIYVLDAYRLCEMLPNNSKIRSIHWKGSVKRKQKKKRIITK